MKVGSPENFLDQRTRPRLHAAWVRHVSETADTSLHEQVPEQHGDQRSVGVATSSLNDPERLDERDNFQQRNSVLRRRAGAVTMVLIASALAAVGIVSLYILRSSREPRGHTTEMLSLPEGLTTGIAATGSGPGSSKLMVQSSPTLSGEPAPLGVTVRGAANGGIVLLRGLPQGMELSTGNAVADGVWELSAADLPDVWVAPPVGFVGSAHLVAELQLPNSQIIDRQPVHLEWTRQEMGTATNAPAALQHPNDPDLRTATPDISPKPSGVAPSDHRESNKRAHQDENNVLRPSVNEGSRRAPSGSPSVGDSSRPPKGFWDWSR